MKQVPMRIGLCVVAMVAVLTPTAAHAGRAPKAEARPRPAPRPIKLAPGLDAPLREALTNALNAESLDGAEVGFLAVRLRDGAVLAESGGDLPINPASNAKLITSAAALDTLKPEYRFKTDYYVAGQLKDGTLHGNLVVKGYGDPTIVSERLSRVANDLYLLGVEKITGAVVVDTSWFDGVEEPRGWEIEEAPDRAYAAPVSALAVNYNAVAVYVRPGSEPGKPAVIRVDPPVEHVALEGYVTTERLGRGVRVYSQETNSLGGARTLLTIEGSVGVREAPFRVYRRVYQPARHFGSALVYFLQQRGVKVRHNVVEGTVPAGARLILVDRSPPLTDIVGDLNHYSNNIIAETLVKAMGAELMGAPGTFEKGLEVCRRFLEQKARIPRGSYSLGNGSGLNDVNRFSARQIVRVLQHVARDFETATELMTSLAVAGTQGTIGFRMRDTPAERRLRAKTGTLRGVSALSGYVVDPGGDIVVFAILAQGFRSGASSVWKVQNTIGAALASAGGWRQDDGVDLREGEAVSAAPLPVLEMAPGGAP